MKGCNKVREQIQKREGGWNEEHARQRASKDADRKKGDGEGGKRKSEGAMRLWIIQNELKGRRDRRRGEIGSGSH